MKLLGRVSADTALITIIVAVALCARVVSFGYFSSLSAANPVIQYPIVSGDSQHYASLANGILTLGGYEEVAGVPFRSWPPGYPALLALIKALTGSMTPIVIVQVLFAALAAALIYKMARTLTTAAYAIIPALGYAIDPMVVFSDTSIRTDGIFTALLVLTVYLAFFQRRLSGTLRFALVGLLLGIVTMIRPIAEFLVLVFPALYLFDAWRSGAREEISRLKAVAACVLGFMLVVTPWVVRNEMHFGSFEISNLGAHNLLTYDVRGFLAWRALARTHPMSALLILRHVNDPVFAVVDRDIAHALAAITPPGGNPENYEGVLAVSYIMRDPIRYAYFHAVNTIPFFVSSSIASYKQLARQVGSNRGFYAPTLLSLQSALSQLRHPEHAGAFMDAFRSLAPIALEVLFWLLVLALALVALVRRRAESAILLCAVLVAYFAVLTGPMAASRYRIPAEPYLLILAAVGCESVVLLAKQKLHERAQRIARIV